MRFIKIPAWMAHGLAALLAAALTSLGATEAPRFQSAQPVWPEGRATEKNVTVGFRAQFVVPADHPFERRLELRVGGLAIEARAFRRGAHSEGDAVVAFPSRRVVAIGDVAVKGGAPWADQFMGGGSLDTLQRLNAAKSFLDQYKNAPGVDIKLYDESMKDVQKATKREGKKRSKAKTTGE